MLDTFSAGSLRNVQLWTEDRAATRNFINSRIDPEERRLRDAFAYAVLDLNNYNGPTKTKEIDLQDPQAGMTLREYMLNPWIGGHGEEEDNLVRITISSDAILTIVYKFDSEGLGGGKEMTPDNPEFAGIYATVNGGRPND